MGSQQLDMTKRLSQHHSYSCSVENLLPFLSPKYFLFTKHPCLYSWFSPSTSSLFHLWNPSLLVLLNNIYILGLHGFMSGIVTTWSLSFYLTNHPFHISHYLFSKARVVPHTKSASFFNPSSKMSNPSPVQCMTFYKCYLPDFSKMIVLNSGGHSKKISKASPNALYVSTTNSQGGFWSVGSFYWHGFRTTITFGFVFLFLYILSPFSLSQQ